jgi:hypothetical protein
VRRDGSQKREKSGGRRYVWGPAAEARSFCTEDPAGWVAPATGEYRVPPEGEGEGPRHPASAQKSQHNYPAKALKAVGRGVGQAEPLAPAFQLSPSTATETKKKRVRPPPLQWPAAPIQGPREGACCSLAVSSQCPPRLREPEPEVTSGSRNLLVAQPESQSFNLKLGRHRREVRPGARAHSPPSSRPTPSPESPSSIGRSLAVQEECGGTRRPLTRMNLHLPVEDSRATSSPGS